MRVIEGENIQGAAPGEDRVERVLRMALGLGLTKVLIVGMDDRPSGEVCVMTGNLGADESIGVVERAKLKLIKIAESAL